MASQLRPPWRSSTAKRCVAGILGMAAWVGERDEPAPPCRHLSTPFGVASLATRRLVRRPEFRAVLGKMSLLLKFEPLLILIVVKQVRLRPLIKRAVN